MSNLPMKRMVLYKHGVGYFERRGTLNGETLTLSFPLEAMDDVLKSLIVIDRSGQVRNIDVATPEDRAALIARGSIHLSDQRSLLDLLRDLRGRTVRFTLTGKQGETISGLVIGVDVEEEEPLRRALVSLYLSDERAVRPIPLDEVARVELLDDAAHNDLAFSCAPPKTMSAIAPLLFTSLPASTICWWAMSRQRRHGGSATGCCARMATMAPPVACCRAGACLIINWKKTSLMSK